MEKFSLLFLFLEETVDAEELRRDVSSTLKRQRTEREVLMYVSVVFYSPLLTFSVSLFSILLLPLSSFPMFFPLHSLLCLLQPLSLFTSSSFHMPFLSLPLSLSLSLTRYTDIAYSVKHSFPYRKKTKRTSLSRMLKQRMLPQRWQ